VNGWRKQKVLLENIWQLLKIVSPIWIGRSKKGKKYPFASPIFLFFRNSA
jgi:hypothetical protein